MTPCSVTICLIKPSCQGGFPEVQASCPLRLPGPGLPPQLQLPGPVPPDLLLHQGAHHGLRARHRHLHLHQGHRVQPLLQLTFELI